MRLRLAVLSGAFALSAMVSMERWRMTSRILGNSQPLERRDLEDERLSNAHARQRAAERIGWKDEGHEGDPVIDIKLLGSSTTSTASSPPAAPSGPGPVGVPRCWRQSDQPFGEFLPSRRRWSG